MRIGALNAYNFQPYVYNTNTVSSASMNKLSKISDDVLDKKVDYNELTDESQNINPLKKGQTLNFQSMLEMQMQRSQNNAARIMKPAQDSQEEERTQTSNANVTQFAQTSAQAQETAASVNTANSATSNSDNSNINYQMQQALNAYGMFMTA